MQAGLAFGLLLALASAYLFNLSYILQHGAFDRGPEVDLKHPITTLRALFSDRPWLIGTVAGAVGFVLNAVALAFAPLSLVQAFLASGLAFAVPMSVRMAGHKTSTRDVVGVSVMTAALILLAFGTGEQPESNSFSAATLLLVTLVTVGASLAFGLLVRGDRAAEALAIAGGLLFGISDALVNALVGVIKTGADQLITSPWLWICIASNVGAFFAWQRSLQIGRTKVLVLIVLMTATTNVLAIGAGFAVFGDPLGATALWEAVHIFCFVAVGVSIWMLAPAQAAIATSVESKHP